VLSDDPYIITMGRGRGNWANFIYVENFYNRVERKSVEKIYNNVIKK